MKSVSIRSFSSPHFPAFRMKSPYENCSWKVSKFRDSLIRIFQKLDWIRRNTPYLSVFSPNEGKIWIMKTPNTSTFDAVQIYCFTCWCWLLNVKPQSSSSWMFHRKTFLKHWEKFYRKNPIWRVNSLHFYKKCISL